jgi:hypothetical protein
VAGVSDDAAVLRDEDLDDLVEPRDDMDVSCRKNGAGNTFSDGRGFAWPRNVPGSPRRGGSWVGTNSTSLRSGGTIRGSGGLREASDGPGPPSDGRWRPKAMGDAGAGEAAPKAAERWLASAGGDGMLASGEFWALAVDGVPTDPIGSHAWLSPLFRPAGSWPIFGRLPSTASGSDPGSGERRARSSRVPQPRTSIRHAILCLEIRQIFAVGAVLLRLLVFGQLGMVPVFEHGRLGFERLPPCRRQHLPPFPHPLGNLGEGQGQGAQLLADLWAPRQLGRGGGGGVLTVGEDDVRRRPTHGSMLVNLEAAQARSEPADSPRPTRPNAVAGRADVGPGDGGGPRTLGWRRYFLFPPLPTEPRPSALWGPDEASRSVW